MQISIDTTKGETNEILLQGSTILEHTYADDPNSPTLKELDGLLQRSKHTLYEITGVTVNPGPGTRFTRTRLGIVVANALAFALQIPVNKKQFETPRYNAEPNIT